MPADFTPIAERCLAHLSVEEAALQAARAGLVELHDAVVRGTITDLTAAVERAGKLADQTREARAVRLTFCRSMADALDLSPESITLSVIASRLPVPLADRIAAARDRLQALSADLRNHASRTASVVGHCRTFLRKLFADLTDSGAAAIPYGPGPRPTAASGAILVARG